MAISESELITPMFTNIATLWSNRLVGLFIDWRVFIILIEIKLIIGLRILSFEIKESMTELKQIAGIKRIHSLLGLISLDVSSQGLKDTEEENFAKDMPPVLVILIRWIIILVGLNTIALLQRNRA